MKVTIKEPDDTPHPAVMKTGQTFIYNNTLFMVTRDHENNDPARVVNLETGIYHYPRDFTSKRIVLVDAEVTATV